MAPKIVVTEVASNHTSSSITCSNDSGRRVAGSVASSSGSTIELASTVAHPIEDVELAPSREEFRITVEREDFVHELREKLSGKPVGMELLRLEAHLEVIAIESGPIAEWNRNHRGYQPDVEVRPGDYIIEVNSISHPGQKMFAELLKPNRIVTILLNRETKPKINGTSLALPGPSQSWVERKSASSWILQAVQAAVNPISKGVAERMGQLYSTKGQEVRSFREREEQQRVQQMVQACRDAPLKTLHAKELGENRWSIQGVYAYQALKVGLRHLNDLWQHEDMSNFLLGRFILKRNIIEKLLSGDMELNAVPKSDVSAAQRDVQCLSIAQLVRLKVMCMEIDLKSEAHQSFLTAIDRELFVGLGRKACEHVSALVEDVDAERGRIGLEAIQLLAAATALASPCMWSWWITPEERVVFHSQNFQFLEIQVFPDCGVFEVSDNSKKDLVSGLAMMDWQIRLVSSETKLQTAEEHMRTCCNMTLGDLVTEQILAQSLGQLRKRRSRVLTGYGSLHKSSLQSDKGTFMGHRNTLETMRE